MDIATVLGIVSAFGLLLTAIFMGGGLNIFINVAVFQNRQSN